MNITRTAKELVKAILWKGAAESDGLKAVRVLSGPAAGTRLRIDIRCESAYWLGSYDRSILRRITALVRPGQTVWDCGSFLGYYAAALRKKVGSSGRVICFEASSRNYERLLPMPAVNGWTNVEVIRMAVGPDHTTLRFVSGKGAASGPADMPGKSAPGSLDDVENVACAGIDELVYEKGYAMPDFIKMDLETAEVYALRNGSRLFTEKKPAVLIELHKDPKDRVPPAFEAAEEFLNRFGYEGTEVHLNRRVRTVSDFIEAEKKGVQCTILAVPSR